MSEKWTPEIGDAYYFFDSDFNVTIAHYDGYTWDEERIAMGNCFNTKDDACDAAEKVKALLLSLHESVTACNQLPKLTTEVFDRPDCPKWAKYAAVDMNGIAHYFDERPYLMGTFFYNNRAHHWSVDGKFDISDWKNSLIERSVKLPDWCKVGEWVWLDPQKITGANGYEKVTNVDGLGLMFESGLMVCFSHRILQARLRPYTAEELRGLVGVVICNGPSVHFVTGYENVFDGESMVHVNGCLYSANDLLRKGFTYDTRPCGRLEHLENGEWVK